jgi:hypothetical protein
VAQAFPPPLGSEGTELWRGSPKRDKREGGRPAIAALKRCATSKTMSTVTAQPPASPLTFREVLRIDVIRRIWYAQLVSLFGDFLALFAVIAVVSFRMHGTPSQLTGVQIAYMLPMVFVGPIAGVFVDRWPLKPTLIASDLVRAVLALLLIVSTEVWHVYLVLGALSCVLKMEREALADREPARDRLARLKPRAPLEQERYFSAML